MITGAILRVGELSECERVNRARENLRMENEDIIVISRDGYPAEIETLLSTRNILKDSSLATLEDAMAALVAAREQ